ncbi:MAG: hypothetical protein WA108_07225 [Thiobacillus sp.]|jgi:hypothetical protein
MLHTFPDAELPIPSALAPNGERTWSWVELGLKLPYYFVTVLFTDDNDVKLERHLILSDLRTIQELAANPPSHVHLQRVDLLSPGYMNGSSGYQLAQLSEVWQASGEQRFIMADGAEQNLHMDGKRIPKSRFLKILDVPT